MRLIDADALIGAIRHDADQAPDSNWGNGLNHAIPIVRSQPTVDTVPVVRCKYCKHRPKKPEREDYESGFDIEFPDGKCPCQCSGDEWYSWYPEDDWFCADGERE